MLGIFNSSDIIKDNMKILNADLKREAGDVGQKA